MSRNKYNNDIYSMYLEECSKNKDLTKELKYTKLENENLKYELNYKNDSFEQKIKYEIEKATLPLIEKNNKLQRELDKALIEIERLKNQINNSEDDKTYTIDKLKNQVNKNSTNSSIPTSKEINNKSGANVYNHREKSNKKVGGQFNHKGNTLTKTKIEEKIDLNKIEVRKIVHYINGKSNQKNIIKYRVGIETKPYVEKHIFIKIEDSIETLPKSFYSDVTYCDDLKMIIVALGNYFSLPYNKIKEFIYDFTDGIIDISEGTIDNTYEEFSSKLDDTLENITNNLLNGTYQHTDETTTKENGKDAYYRGYANKENVLYKYHHHKGDKPIEEDGILTNYFGTIISDHDTGIFKYGVNNQDCIIHFGRYCIEKDQNIDNISWPMDLYRLLLKFERNRKILSKFGRKNFTKKEIKDMEDEFDSILVRAEAENNNIISSYWKEKTKTLRNRCIKYKKSMLFYIYDFTVPYDNNFIERALRMIKGKTKVSGGFRSKKGAIRFGKIMSIIKTAKLRKMNPFHCIKEIFAGNALFA
ncbi:MAG: transposase [Clostridia bacterium]